jgi:EAL domain-containing protein (putative c-di-GMP-specific phosphodiesterase class I)
VPAFLIALGVAAFGAFRQRQIQRNLVFAAGVSVLLAAPLLLDARLIFVDVVPALAMIVNIWGVLAWRNLKKRGLVNAVSGLPNLSALRASGSSRDQAIIACRVLNYEEVLASLPPDSERQLVEQVVARLKVGSNNRILYQGDAGIFVWFEDAKLPFSHHIEALSALFRKAARVGGLPIDLAVTFGVEIGSSRSLQNRVASALVAAEEAAHDGLKWKYHDPDTLQDASWKLSMLSELDEAIDRNEVGVAYQPKLDIKTRKIVGAEALARWTHPVKGPIAASEFVAAAEQHDRIGKLTDFVLEKAVAAAAALNKRGEHFEIAVNLSARLLTDKGFTLRVAALLARHRLDAGLLTLELTETAALADDGESLEMITRLRELGVGISIDDYGTGLSTLDYLKKIPANEIKIDQSFVKGMVDNRSDRLMVQSTIGLAHSLGRKVVAEGVEQREILDLLVEMECDVAQGFSIGRPMSLDSLTKRLASDRKRHVA